MAQVAQINRDSAQAEAQVSHHESRVKEVKNITDKDREQLRCVADAPACVPAQTLNPLRKNRARSSHGAVTTQLDRQLLSSSAA